MTEPKEEPALEEQTSEEAAPEEPEVHNLPDSGDSESGDA